MKIVLAEPLTISKAELDRLSEPLVQAGHEFVSFDGKPSSAEDWVSRCEGAEVVILANTPMPEEALDRLPSLRYLDVAFTGTDHVPVAAAKERGILVSNAAGYSDQAVAELVIGMSIELLRELKRADAEIRNGGKTADFLGSQISGRRVGIIGTGKIGYRTAKLFKAFGAEVVAYSRTERPKVVAAGVSYVSLDELLETSDIISLHLPLNDSTRRFLRAEHFAKLKPDAILINCARGPVIDNKALAKALKAGALGGAGIDVYDQEPPFEHNPYFSCPNVILTPHIAYHTKEAMALRAKIVFENALDYVEGREVKTLV